MDHKFCSVRNTLKKRRLEFFKLDEIDRKVLFWLVDHVKLNAVRSWLDVVGEDYRKRYGIVLNTECLFEEAKEVFENGKP